MRFHQPTRQQPDSPTVALHPGPLHLVEVEFLAPASGELRRARAGIIRGTVQRGASDRDLLHLVERNLIRPPVVELRRAR